MLYALCSMRSLSSIRPYLDLCRVSNLPTVWTNVLAALVLSGGSFSWPSFFILVASLSLFYSGGMCLNDLFDAQVDQMSKPFRPIPSGRISIKKARIFAVILFGIGLVLLLFVPHPKSVFAGFLLVAIIVIYDRIHKRHPFTAILMAACRLMVFVISGIAVAGEVRSAVALAGFLQFVYILILTLVSRYENRIRGKSSFPLIPWMLAGISSLDGILMAALASPAWFVAGLAGVGLTRFGQKYVIGD